MNIERYSRQLILKEWSQSLQQKLALTSIALPTSDLAAGLYASALGIGTIYLYGEKLSENQSRLEALNPDVKVLRLAPLSPVNFLFVPPESPQPPCLPQWVVSIEGSHNDGTASLVAMQSSGDSRSVQWPIIPFDHLGGEFAAGTQAVLLALSITR